MESNLIMLVVIIGFGLFAGAMFAYRKVTNGEAFEPLKFLPMMGYGAIAALVLYMAAGTLPGIDAIFTYIELLAPGGAPAVSVIIATILAIINGFMNVAKPAVTANLTGSRMVAAVATVTPQESMIGKRVKMADGRYAVINGDDTFTYDDGSIVRCDGTIVRPATTVIPVPSTPAAIAPAPVYEEVVTNSLGPGYISSGFNVDPSDNKGISPFTPELRIEVGMSRDQKTRPKVRIDWKDGTPEETFSVRPADGVVWVKHLYTYIKGKEDDYFSKQFYPTFYVVDAIDGTVQTFNLLGDRRCCWVLVESPGSAPQ